MTTWMDWHSWTHFVVGSEVVYAGKVLELDFDNRRIKYLRDTGNRYEDNPHPFGTEECEAFLRVPAEATFDQVWVDPTKRSSWNRQDLELLGAGKKPPSLVELVDTDPRIYFRGSNEIMSYNGVPMSLPKDEGAPESEATPEPLTADQAFEKFQQFQRDYAKGFYNLMTAVPLSISLLGAIEDIEPGWRSLDPWLAVEVRSTLRDVLIQRAARSPDSDGSPIDDASLRLAEWAERSGILADDPAYTFMNQPPVDILEFVRRQMGQELPDPGMTWFGLACDAEHNAHEGGGALVWLTIGIEIREWIASQKADPDNSSSKLHEMYSRARRFFRNENFPPSKAAICPRDSCKQSGADTIAQTRIARRLGVFELLHEAGATLPPRIGEWLALIPHLR